MKTAISLCGSASPPSEQTESSTGLMETSLRSKQAKDMER
jgi:hypothetical protein